MPVDSHTTENVWNLLLEDMELNMESRKGARRFQVTWESRVSNPKFGVVYAKTQDISLSGALIIIPIRYPIKTELSIQIEMGETRFIRCVGYISRELPNSRGGYACGVRFLRFVPGDQELLNDVLLNIRQIEFEKGKPAVKPKAA